MLKKITRFVYYNSIKILVVAVMFYLLSQQALEVNIGHGQQSEKQLVSLNTNQNHSVSVPQRMATWWEPTAAEFERLWHSSRLFVKAQFRDRFGNKPIFENIDETTVNNFVKRFQRLAINEQTEFGIPASVIMAHSLLQSEAGTSEAFKKGNNLFSIVCTQDWQGQSLTTLAGTCFRKYDSVETSFRDNSFFLTTGRLSQLTVFSSTDYRQWAQGIGRTLQPAPKNYGRKLIRTIELLELEKLDVIE